jgi:hypothetical protein
MPLALAVGLLVVVGLVLMWLQAQRLARAVTADRRSALEDAAGALGEPQLEQRGIDYPVLSGSYGGHRVLVSVIVDAIALRGLPTLWLSVTLYKPLALPGPIDILLRPNNTDIVSPGIRFTREHEAPPDWPALVRIATPSGLLPQLRALAPALPLLHDRRTKDLLLAPAGARVVTELARAELGHYRLYRRVKFKAHLTEERLVAVLASLVEATADLEKQTPASHG